MATKTKKYYAYLIPDTHKSGITDDWEKCKKLISGKTGATYKGFKTKEEAGEWLEAGADYSHKKSLPKGIYFDAGTGRGDGVEISVTDEKGKDLLATIMPKEFINRHGKHLIPRGVTNNYGELLACRYALELALREGMHYVYGDSKLVIDYWSKGYIKDEVAAETIDLALEVVKLRREFEQKGGILDRVSGDDNPADLGFHR
ncbi:MAG: ribonuclease H family protein [Candidatus Sungbacteria bacterium]|nr:ribonuclease H family protein [bacterium]MDZ4260083.1 ribonuclease H family protein [Candidatus Sungbacteria bacterium]